MREHFVKRNFMCHHSNVTSHKYTHHIGEKRAWKCCANAKRLRSKLFYCTEEQMILMWEIFQYHVSRWKLRNQFQIQHSVNLPPPQMIPVSQPKHRRRSFSCSKTNFKSQLVRAKSCFPAKSFEDKSVGEILYFLTPAITFCVLFYSNLSGYMRMGCLSFCQRALWVKLNPEFWMHCCDLPPQAHPIIE